MFTIAARHLIAVLKINVRHALFLGMDMLAILYCSSICSHTIATVGPPDADRHQSRLEAIVVSCRTHRVADSNSIWHYAQIPVSPCP